MTLGTIDIVTPPAVEPVTLADMLAHLKIDVPDDQQNAVLTGCIAAARQHLEKSTGRAFVTQTLRQRLDCFPCHGVPIVLLRTPAVSVSSVAYVDPDGETQTLTADTDYAANLGAGQSELGPIGCTRWPATRRQPGAVTITYVAGYGNAAAVPADLVAAIKLLAAAWFETRGDHVISQGVSVTAIPRGVEAIIQTNRTSLNW